VFNSKRTMTGGTFRSTQPSHPFVGERSEYEPIGGDAVQAGVKAGTARVLYGGRWNCDSL